MNNEVDNEERLVRYLLGELSEAEQLRLEELFFTEEDFFEQLSALEHELRYDYAQGKLAPPQRELFEKRFLTSTQERRGVERASAILHTLESAKAKRVAAGVPEPKQQGLWQALTTFFSSQGAAVRFAFATTALLLVATTSWFIYQTVKLRSQLEQVQAERKSEGEKLRNQTEKDQARITKMNSDLERERLAREHLEQELAQQQAQPPAQQSSQPSLLSGVLSFVLSPGGVRSEGEKSKKLSIPQATKAIQLELQLKKKSDYRSFRAQLLTADGAAIWSRDHLRLSGRKVVLQLPVTLLAEGDYELALKGRAANRDYEEAGSYYFTIIKK
jgi:hypothetical protein